MEKKEVEERSDRLITVTLIEFSPAYSINLIKAAELKTTKVIDLTSQSDD